MKNSFDIFNFNHDSLEQRWLLSMIESPKYNTILMTWFVILYHMIKLLAEMCVYVYPDPSVHLFLH